MNYQTRRRLNAGKHDLYRQPGNRAGTLYLLQEIEAGVPTGLYKIGMTRTTTGHRRDQYQTGNARELRPIFEVVVDDRFKAEATVHRQWAAHAFNSGGGTEWFEFNSAQLASVKQSLSEQGQEFTQADRLDQREPQRERPQQQAQQQQRQDNHKKVVTPITAANGNTPIKLLQRQLAGKPVPRRPIVRRSGESLPSLKVTAIALLVPVLLAWMAVLFGGSGQIGGIVDQHLRKPTERPAEGHGKNAN